MEKVRLGIIGLGNMGTTHIKNFNAGKIPNGVVTAVCDIDETALKNGAALVDHEVKTYTDALEMIKSDDIDAVLVATPHYLHPVYGMEALKADKHVLVEKPAGVYAKAVSELNAMADKSDKVFGVMFNQRTNPLYKKLKDLIDSGELGEITRVNWIITDWYRTQQYYDSGSWRATWEGEGGGVLLNQAPHQLDLIQWLCGIPSKVTAHCGYGKYHDIEVEDDVTIFMEYPNGATGVFITTTGDYPGTNRLEIAGTRGKVVVEKANSECLGIVDTHINFYRNRTDLAKHTVESPMGFRGPDCWKCKIEVNGDYPAHSGILTNFFDAILKGDKLLAPGQEGINGVRLSNAAHMSDWLGNVPVELPVDEDKFYEMLQDKIKNSTRKKKVVENKGPANLDSTY